jgi:hypothetical protein
MKNYLVFYGNFYYPSGGMDDFLKDYDLLDDAIDALNEHNQELNNGDWGYNWGYVYSLKDKLKIYKN